MDAAANPAYVAADLLSQAEHDRLATAVLVCDSEALAGAVSAELERLLKIPDPHIHLGTDFGAARTQIEGEAGVAFRIGDLLIIGLGFGIPLLKWLRKRKKEIEQSVKAAPPPAQEQTAS